MYLHFPCRSIKIDLKNHNCIFQLEIYYGKLSIVKMSELTKNVITNGIQHYLVSLILTVKRAKDKNS